MFARVPEISPEELASLRRENDSPVLLDVRESPEYAISDLPGSTKIPLNSLPQRVDELPRDREIVVYCRSGARSASAVAFLRQRGFEKVRNLAGGINRWAEAVDPSMTRY